MKPNFKLTLLSITAISLTGSLVFAATQQDSATVAYVNDQDINVEKAILDKGGFVGPSADTCRKPGYGSGTPASIAYVNECDLELYEAIETIPIGSPFAIGDILCGNSHPYTCPASEADPWGIVIYADPNPTTSGFYGLAMSVADVVQGCNSLPCADGAGTVWANGDLQSTDIDGVSYYGIYEGINGTFKNYLGNATSGNTKTFCNADGSDCAGSTSSAFNACVTHSDGPSLAGGWYLPSIAEIAQMFTYAQTQPLSDNTNVGTFDSFWYWSSTQWNGAYNAASFTTTDRTYGNLGYNPSIGGPQPATEAFYFGFVDGTQNGTAKSDSNKGVRCMQALPV